MNDVWQLALKHLSKSLANLLPYFSRIGKGIRSKKKVMIIWVKQHLHMTDVLFFGPDLALSSAQVGPCVCTEFLAMHVQGLFCRLKVAKSP